MFIWWNEPLSFWCCLEFLRLLEQRPQEQLRRVTPPFIIYFWPSYQSPAFLINPPFIGAPWVQNSNFLWFCFKLIRQNFPFLAPVLTKLQHNRNTINKIKSWALANANQLLFCSVVSPEQTNVNAECKHLNRLIAWLKIKFRSALIGLEGFAGALLAFGFSACVK